MSVFSAFQKDSIITIPATNGDQKSLMTLLKYKGILLLIENIIATPTTPT